MRIRNIFLAALLSALACSLFPGTSSAADSADPVAIQYHFAGAADLAGNTNFDRAKRILTLPRAIRFQDLVLNRWAGIFWNALQFDPGGDSSALLRPLLNDLLRAESTGSFGGHDKERLDFVLAARLDAKSAETWQKNLETALHGPGQPLTAEGFSGRRWDRPGNHAFWILRARDWIVAGRGEDLLPVRAQYLQRIKQDNRPAPMAKDDWLTAEVDWPLLATWAPLANCPLKLARTSFNVTAEGGRFKATNYVTYPAALPWTPQPWRIPKELVNSPLSSFTALRNPEAYLNPDRTFSRLSGDPLTNQLFCWGLREMALLNYAAWPVADATNTLRKIGVEAPPIFDPILEARNHSKLSWVPKDDRLFWLHLQMAAPSLEPASGKSGDFLLARTFPLVPNFVPASEQLWSQFQKRDDVVYYDWEMTGLRMMQWRLLSEILPVLPRSTPEEEARRQKAAKNAKAPSAADQLQTPTAITEAWLAELSSPILDNTVTEAIRTSPAKLTVVRNSQFLFTGLELVLLSHWLADAPVGPLDFSLLPQAKMSGPGQPKPH